MRRKKSQIQALWKKILDALSLLPFGRKLVLFSSLGALVFLFFPWFDSNAEGSLNAFGKVPIFGIVLLLFSLFSVLLVGREIFSKRGFIGNFSHGDILLFLFGQGLYTVILATFVLHKFVITSDQQVEFGVMLTFLAFGIGGAGALFSKDYIPKGDDRKIFVDPKDVDLDAVNLQPETQLSLSDYDQR